MKKNGSLRLVQDFRALNAKSLEDKYSMKDIQECIDEIGQSGSTIFTTIDLTAGFWQMILQPKARQYTAFTVPVRGNSSGSQCPWDSWELRRASKGSWKRWLKTYRTLRFISTISSATQPSTQNTWTFWTRFWLD